MGTVLRIDKNKSKTEPETGKIIFRYSDLIQTPEWPEGPLLEIIGGELYIVPSPNLKNQKISAQLLILLKTYVDEYDLGEVYGAPVDVVLSDENVIIPDLVFVSRDNSDILKETNIQGTLDIVVEFLSTNRDRDLSEKYQLYEQFGVHEYVIVDPQEEIVIIFVYDENEKQFLPEKKYSGSMAISLTTIPNLKIHILDIF